MIDSDSNKELPRATVANLAKKYLVNKPKKVRTKKNFYDWVNTVSSELIQKVTLSATNIWEEKGKKLLNAQFLFDAMSDMGFEGYLTKIFKKDDMKEVYKMNESEILKVLEEKLKNPKKKKNPLADLTEEEYEQLAKQQDEVFKKALEGRPDAEEVLNRRASNGDTSGSI